MWIGELLAVYTPEKPVTSCEVTSGGHTVVLALRGQSHITTLHLHGPNVPQLNEEQPVPCYGNPEYTGKIFQMQEEERWRPSENTCSNLTSSERRWHVFIDMKIRSKVGQKVMYHILPISRLREAAIITISLFHQAQYKLLKQWEALNSSMILCGKCICVCFTPQIIYSNQDIFKGMFNYSWGCWIYLKSFNI